MSANEKAGAGWHPTGFRNNISPDDSTPSRSAVARNILRDAIVALGLTPGAGVALLAAAESYAKARVRDELADRDLRQAELPS